MCDLGEVPENQNVGREMTERTYSYYLLNLVCFEILATRLLVS